MAFEGLSEKLNAVFKRLKGRGILSEADVREAMREVKMALLEADVSYKVVKEFVAKVTERAVGSDVLASLTPAQQVIKIVNEELVSLMGNENARINYPSMPPCIIMMVGLQGSGKTTHAAKLAKYFKAQGKRPLLAACDVYRPAAINQLMVVGEKAGVKVFEMGQINPVVIAKEAVKHAKEHGNEVVILDTAGRLHIDEELMNELKNIREETSPHEIMLVVDAMTGQDAVNVAKAYEFVGTGEKLDDFELFHPERMASRILGMGDMLTLIERAQSTIDEEEAKRLTEKLAEDKGFDLEDMLEQMKQIKKMGPIKQIAAMLPGVGDKINDMDIDDRQILRIEALITSMTPAERAKPSIINPSRKKRIAAGSGNTVADVNRLLRQFEQMQKMLKQLGVTGRNQKGKKNRLRLPGMWR